MSYIIMLITAAVLALMSSIMTAFGMVDLFKAAGTFILILFIIIDLGRFLLFNFTVNEWYNLRKVKYLIVFILLLLFGYSAVGIYSKLDSLVVKETKQAMINAAIYNKANENAQTKQNRSEDLAKIAQEEYRNTLEWNRNDHINCLARANGNKNAENRCNNTKRSLDNKASAALKDALAKADESLDKVEENVKLKAENQSEIANVLTTICKLTQSTCNSYDNLQNALSILIFLVIVGTDYLQIAIVLAVNTRKNKIVKKTPRNVILNSSKKETNISHEKIQQINMEFQESKPILEEQKVLEKENKIKISSELPQKIENVTKNQNIQHRPFKFTGPKPAK